MPDTGSQHGEMMHVLKRSRRFESPPLSPLGPHNPTALPPLARTHSRCYPPLSLAKSLLAIQVLTSASWLPVDSCKTAMMMTQACRWGPLWDAESANQGCRSLRLARAASARLRGPRGGFGRRCNAGICAFRPWSREIVMRISRRVAVAAAASAPPGLAKPISCRSQCRLDPAPKTDAALPILASIHPDATTIGRSLSPSTGKLN